MSLKVTSMYTGKMRSEHTQCPRNVLSFHVTSWSKKGHRYYFQGTVIKIKYKKQASVKHLMAYQNTICNLLKWTYSSSITGNETGLWQSRTNAVFIYERAVKNAWHFQVWWNSWHSPLSCTKQHLIFCIKAPRPNAIIWDACITGTNVTGLCRTLSPPQDGMPIVGIKLRLQNAGKCSLSRELSLYHCREKNYCIQVYQGAGEEDMRGGIKRKSWEVKGDSWR